MAICLGLDSIAADTWSWPFDTVCMGTKIFGYVEMACMLWFTCELTVRFWLCDNWKSYFVDVVNIIDLLAVLPYYAELTLSKLSLSSIKIGDHVNSLLLPINNRLFTLSVSTICLAWRLLLLTADDPEHLRKARDIILALRVARTARIVQVLKFVRHSEELKVLGRTMRAATKELYMMFLFLVISLLIFASIVYHLEKYEPDTQFTSIPAACWWGIATVSTVGYGDMTTRTTVGKLVASLACVFGILVMAFPVSILVEHFNSAYKKCVIKDQPGNINITATEAPVTHTYQKASPKRPYMISKISTRI